MNRAILVKSCQKNRERQLACAHTWIRATWGKATVMIIEGGCSRNFATSFDGPSNQDFGYPVIGKMEVIGDDGYQENSRKLRHAIAMLCNSSVNPEYLFVCDDDTFVHPQRWLAHEPTGDIECRLYMPRNAHEWKRNNGRPWIHGGAGWWMSRRMCELYVEHCQERTSGDDIVAARIAQEHDLEIVDRPDLYGCNSYGGNAGLVSADNSLITCHPVKPEEMRTLYEATNGL